MALLCLTSMLPRSALCQALEVAPVNVELPAHALATTLSVTNRSTQPMQIQVRPFSWSQPDGSEHLDPSDDLMISPPLTAIPPGGAQVIRLVLRRGAGVAEQSFRVWVDQIPAPGEPGTVRIAVRLSIPVFVEPASAVTPTLQWRMVELANGRAELVATNHGGRHAKILHATVFGADGAQWQVDSALAPYVLPGATRRWPVNGAIATATGLRLIAMTDAGRIEQPLGTDSAP